MLDPGMQQLLMTLKPLMTATVAHATDLVTAIAVRHVNLLQHRVKRAATFTLVLALVILIL